MRKKKNKRQYMPGDGIRRRYYDSMEPDRWRFPRKGLVHHAREWYLSEAPLKRPVFGVYAMAAFGEDMLWRARFAKKGLVPDFRAAAEFFAFTRRAMQNVLSSYRIDVRLNPSEARSLRKVVAMLVDGARKLVATMQKKETQSV